MPPPSTLTNRDLSEHLALRSHAQEDGSQRQRALRRASRLALTWPEEAAVIAARGESLTSLAQVGPFVAAQLHELLDADVAPPPVPPERAGFLTRAEAEAAVAAHPAWRDAVRCDLQVHTTTSDGHASLAEMAAGCIARGYSHMAVTDHSEGLQIAHGMDEARRTAQADEVRALNAGYASDGTAFSILHGIEMNLEPDGSADTAPEVCASLDIVLGAFHSKLRLKDDQTERYVAALRNPSVDVLAHPRGRMFNFRLGLTARWEDVFEAAATYGVALEVDGYPARQDLDVALVQRAAAYDVIFAVDTDSHHPVDLDAMPYGVAALALAGVAPSRVLNTWPLEQLRAWVAERRAAASARTGRAVV